MLDVMRANFLCDKRWNYVGGAPFDPVPAMTLYAPQPAIHDLMVCIDSTKPLLPALSAGTVLTHYLLCTSLFCS
jgi:hypothetical protein